MIKNYIKIAIRNLTKQKGLSFINVFGLSVGLACFVLFLLYSVNEFGFDRFHKNAKNIYRVYYHHDAVHGEDASSSSYLPIPLGPAMKENFPEVEQFVRVKDSWEEAFIKADGKVHRPAKATTSSAAIICTHGPQAATSSHLSMRLTNTTALRPGTLYAFPTTGSSYPKAGISSGGD